MSTTGEPQLLIEAWWSQNSSPCLQHWTQELGREPIWDLLWDFCMWNLGERRAFLWVIHCIHLLDNEHFCLCIECVQSKTEWIQMQIKAETFRVEWWWERWSYYICSRTEPYLKNALRQPSSEGSKCTFMPNLVWVGFLSLITRVSWFFYQKVFF